MRGACFLFKVIYERVCHNPFLGCDFLNLKRTQGVHRCGLVLWIASRGGREPDWGSYRFGGTTPTARSTHGAYPKIPRQNVLGKKIIDFESISRMHHSGMWTLMLLPLSGSVKRMTKNHEHVKMAFHDS